MTDLFQISSAAISTCGTYRHWLRRRWDIGPTMGFIMLNPSTADADNDDPTIRRCISFARREGCGGILVANLFQLRATDPSALATHPDPFGPHADHVLLDVAGESDGPLVAAWGAHSFAAERAAYVTAMIGIHCVCLGKTKDGHPRHPLYVRGTAPLVPLLEIANAEHEEPHP